MEFRTAYGEKLKNHSPAGSKIEIRHRAEMKKDGRRVLIRDRKVNVYELIQASREDCEIENIIRRAVQGDYNALNAVAGQYADITGMPKSIAEAQQLVINLKESFEKLPKEIKAKFEYNPEIYVAEYGTETWANKTGLKAEYEAKQEALKTQKMNEEMTAAAMKAIATGETIIQKGEVNNE